MTEKITERVSDAIRRARLQWAVDNEGHGGSSNADCPNDVLARAAIEAMKEPTQQMRNAGYHYTEFPEHMWEDMVIAALE